MKIFSLVVILLISCFAAAQKKESDDFMSATEFFRFVVGLGKLGDGNDVPPQALKVIGAGFGRTGTSSYLKAVEMLGLKSYHMKKLVEEKGHGELWARHAKLMSEGKDGIVDEIIQALAEAGFNSTASMPACMIYKDLMKRYPDARVVVTVRGDGDGKAWARSLLGSVGKMFPFYWRKPLRWTSTFRHFRTVIPWVFRAVNAPLDPDSHQPSADDLAQAYDDWLNEVKATVPEDKLLLFAPQDGWRPLCDFLSPLDSSIRERCDEILASGVPYPRVNDTATVKKFVKALSVVAEIYDALPFVAIAAIASWVIFGRSGLRGKVKKT